MTKDELQAAVNRLGPWHYNHAFPYGVTTGDLPVEYVHPKLRQLLNAGAFNRPLYPRVLDLGANSGLISMWFADNKGSVVDAVERGQKYYPQLEFAVSIKDYGNVIHPINADICSYLPEPCSYDLILFLGTMHHLPKECRMTVLETSLSALLPGGEIVVQTRSDFPVSEMLELAGFLHIRQLSTNWNDRAAWIAMRDPMKVCD